VAMLVSACINQAVSRESEFEAMYKIALQSVIHFVKKNPNEAKFYVGYMLHYSDLRLKKSESDEIFSMCPMVKLMIAGIKQNRFYDIPSILFLGYTPVYSYALDNLNSNKEQDELFINSLWRAISTDFDLSAAIP
jgi:hypothetical protein